MHYINHRKPAKLLLQLFLNRDVKDHAKH